MGCRFVGTTDRDVVVVLLEIYRPDQGTELDLDIGVPPLEARHARDEPAHHERRRGTHPKRRGCCLLEQLRGGDSDAIERRRDHCEIATAGLGQRKLRERASEQRCTEPRFKQADLPAHRTTRDVEFHGSLRKAHMPRRDFEGAHCVQGWEFSHDMRWETEYLSSRGRKWIAQRLIVK